MLIFDQFLELRWFRTQIVFINFLPQWISCISLLSHLFKCSTKILITFHLCEDKTIIDDTFKLLKIWIHLSIEFNQNWWLCKIKMHSSWWHVTFVLCILFSWQFDVSAIFVEIYCSDRNNYRRVLFKVISYLRSLSWGNYSCEFATFCAILRPCSALVSKKWGMRCSL